MRLKQSFYGLVLVLLFLTGCGNDIASGDYVKEETSTLYTGYVVDAPVVNLTYTCGDKTDKTTTGGLFTCSTLPVTFFAGGLELGTLDVVNPDSKVYVQDIFKKSRENFTDEDIKKLALFIQSLDDDGNISQEILINENFTLESSKPFVELSLDEVIALLQNNNITVVSLESAEQHLREWSSIDTLKPVITLNGASIIHLTQGTAYTELGATATDDRDGTVTVTISGSVDVNTVGSYTITYKAVDGAGNEATEVTRTVNVTEVALPADVTKPVIALNGASIITLIKGTAYTELGATATDDRDGTVTVTTSGSVNVNTVGSYTITYKAVDSAGNEATEVTRTVNVTEVAIEDIEAPVFTSSTTATVVENQTTAITLVATDTDSVTITYSIGGGDSAGFNISGGVVTFKVAPDYETKNSYNFVATASDGVHETTQNVTITVSNVADVVPTLTAFSGSVAEDASIGTSIGTVAVGSAGDSAITAYTLSDTTNFEISTAGAITTKTTLDYETTASYALTVTATNGAGVSSAVAVNIAVSDVAEAIAPKKTGQTISYDASGNEVADGTQRDDGYYQTGTTPSYTRDNTNETVTDNVTGLMWQDDDAVSSITKLWVTGTNYDAGNYSDTTGDTATTYCDELVIGAYEDWRLPTSVELESIVHYGAGNPAIDATFQNTSSSYSYYWSSTSLVGNEFSAWLVGFRDGYVNGDSKDFSFYVRCVRAGQ